MRDSALSQGIFRLKPAFCFHSDILPSRSEPRACKMTLENRELSDNFILQNGWALYNNQC